MTFRSIKWPDLPSPVEFSEFVDSSEIAALLTSFPDARLWYYELLIGHSFYDYFSHKVYNKNSKRGEIAFAITNPQGQTLVHTKEFYPPNVYRIPTGGIHPKESVQDAMHRELYEETGFRGDHMSLSDILFQRMIYDQKSIPFVSYLYSGQIDQTNVVSHDPSEQIQEFQWLADEQWPALLNILETLGSEWSDWGRMRAIVHKLLMEK